MIAPPCGSCVYYGFTFAPPLAIFDVKPKIKILRNGQDITSTPQNANIQNVAVGDKIALSVQVIGANGSSTQWTIPENRIKNFVSSASLGQLILLNTQDLNQSSVQFYWVNEGDKNVTVSVTVNNIPYLATAQFNVKQPSVTMDILNSIVNIGINSEVTYFRYGNVSVSPGVTFTATANNNGLTGGYHWIQIYNESKSIKLNSVVENCPSGRFLTRNGQGLDVSYPYVAGLVMMDSPRIVLNTTFNQLSVNDSAVGWLMFKSNQPDSIWIPMKKINWSWGGTAHRIGIENTWTIDTRFNPLPITSTPDSFPEWSRNVDNNSWVCQE